MSKQLIDEFNKLNVEKIIKIYDENFKEDKEAFMDADYLKNYMYLVNNYRDLNKTFMAEKNEEINKNIDTFTNLILNIVNNFKFPIEKVWAILYSYNLYKLYGFKVNGLTPYYLNLLINIYMGLDDKYSLSSLDKITDFIFDSSIKNNINNLNLSLREMTNILLETIHLYLEEDIAFKIPLSYFIKEKLNHIKENRLKIRKTIKLNWDTPEDVYNSLKDEITTIANLMINSNDEGQIEEGRELISNLDMLVCKLKNMSEENYNICMESIKILMEDEKRDFLDKYYLMFSLINQLTTYNSNKGMK